VTVLSLAWVLSLPIPVRTFCAAGRQSCTRSVAWQVVVNVARPCVSPQTVL